METTLSRSVQCECTGKTYKHIKQHQKSGIHIAWVGARELRDLKIVLTHRDNEIVQLSTENDLLRTWVEKLIRLTKECDDQ